MWCVTHFSSLVPRGNEIMMLMAQARLITFFVKGEMPFGCKYIHSVRKVSQRRFAKGKDCVEEEILA